MLYLQFTQKVKEALDGGHVFEEAVGPRRKVLA